MYEYSICNMPDEEIYKKQCAALEKHIHGLKKGDELTDVDYSKTQKYFLDGKRITVHNSFYIGAVYVKSEIDLEQYF